MNELNIDTYNISNNTKLIDLKDMSSLRTRLKELGQYNISLDSLTYLEDGNDYSLGVKLNNQVINYLPYLESEDKIIQYYYDSENNKYIYCVIMPEQVNGLYEYTFGSYNQCMTGEKAIAGHQYYDKYIQNNGVYYAKVIKVQ